MNKYKRYWELDKSDNVRYTNKHFIVGLCVIIAVILIAIVAAILV